MPVFYLQIIVPGKITGIKVNNLSYLVHEPILCYMPVLFNSLQQQTTFYRNSISGNDLNSAELVESTEAIGMEHAGMTFQNWCFEGFRLVADIFAHRHISHGLT